MNRYRLLGETARRLAPFRLLRCDVLVPTNQGGDVTTQCYKAPSQDTRWDTGERIPRRSRMTYRTTATMTPSRLLTALALWRVRSRLSLSPKVSSPVTWCVALLYALQVGILELGGIFQAEASQAIDPNVSEPDERKFNQQLLPTEVADGEQNDR